MHVLDPAWEALKRDFDTACSQAASAARGRLSQDLNQIFRRLRHYAGEAEWYSAVADGAAHFASRVAVFSYSGGQLRLRSQSGLDMANDFTFPVSSAAAFAGAVESAEPIVALRTPAEVTSALAGSDSASRANLFPILNAGRAVAILFAAADGHSKADPVDLPALELVATMAGAVLERQLNSGLHAHIVVPPPASENATEKALPENPQPQSSEPSHPLPPWSQLSRNQRDLHIRAQRFSRVTVAELQLARPEALRAGLHQGNLYLFLKPEIEKARETYRRQFMTIPSMVDYLHLELVRTAAAGDEAKLGADYPGQLL